MWIYAVMCGKASYNGRPSNKFQPLLADTERIESGTRRKVGVTVCSFKIFCHAQISHYKVFWLFSSRHNSEDDSTIAKLQSVLWRQISHHIKLFISMLCKRIHLISFCFSICLLALIFYMMCRYKLYFYIC